MKVKQIPEHIGWYIAGFVDGEGSFNVSFCNRPDHKNKWKTVMTFNVAQRDKTVLALMKRHLGCGRLQARKDGVWYYTVSNQQAINENVIPFFKRFNFFSAKSKKNFAIFTQIARKMLAKEHLTQKGLHEIALLRERLNEGRGRKRKYVLGHIENGADWKSSETTR